jgi:phosphohistidine phosphatase
VDTWELVGTQLHDVPPTTYDERVYGATGEELLEVVRELPDYAASVVIVGHNPGLEDLVSLLTGVWVPMPTSAMAVIDLEGEWSASGKTSEGARGSLRTSGRPPK